MAQTRSSHYTALRALDMVLTPLLPAVAAARDAVEGKAEIHGHLPGPFTLEAVGGGLYKDKMSIRATSATGVATVYSGTLLRPDATPRTAAQIVTDLGNLTNPDSVKLSTVATPAVYTIGASQYVHVTTINAASGSYRQLIEVVYTDAQDAGSTIGLYPGSLSVKSAVDMPAPESVFYRLNNQRAAGSPTRTHPALFLVGNPRDEMLGGNSQVLNRVTFPCAATQFDEHPEAAEEKAIRFGQAIFLTLKTNYTLNDEVVLARFGGDQAPIEIGISERFAVGGKTMGHLAGVLFDMIVDVKAL